MILRKAPAGFPPAGLSLLGRGTTADAALARQRAMFAFLCFVWGTTWLAMKVGVASVPPGFFAGTRWAVAGVVLLCWRWARGQRISVPAWAWPRLLIVSVLMIATNQVIQLYGLRYVPAGLATVISSALTPVSLIGFSAIAGQERFTRRQGVALVLGALGTVMLFGQKAFEGRLDWIELAGALGVIIGCLSYSLGSVLARPLMRTLAPGEVAALTNCIGGFLLLAGSLAFEPGSGAAAAGQWGWPAFLAWLYLLLPGSLGASLIYFFLVRDWGAGRTGSYAFVSPVVGVILAVLLFGEGIDAGEVVGMTLMLGSAALVLRR
ncbi:MAG TPA: EamA family transporter [Acetobacteraceae bacterium]|nr:EamA family transporter [Acetobacteraceae bacterium]